MATASTTGADEPTDEAIVELARRHGLDPLVPNAATIQCLDQAIERIGHKYLTAEPGELTEDDVWKMGVVFVSAGLLLMAFNAAVYLPVRSGRVTLWVTGR